MLPGVYGMTAPTVIEARMFFGWGVSLCLIGAAFFVIITGSFDLIALTTKRRVGVTIAISKPKKTPV